LKMPLICAECMCDDPASANFIASSELNDNSIYEVRCPKGHQSYVVLQQQKFELLFDIGACALLDGYHREAVSSFTSSLERFHEFFIRASFLQNGNTPNDIEAVWKPIAKHSERQFGAYVILYMRECGAVPLSLSSKNIEFRNNVVHRGKIPNRSEAIAYGEAILEAIRPALAVAKLKFEKGVEQLTIQHAMTAHLTLQPGVRIATSCMPTILGLSISEASHSERTLEDALTSLSMWNWRS
jgi:hypothetical protein